MAIAVDPTFADPAPTRLPGDFARHPKTGAPYVSDPTQTRQPTGTKAELVAKCAARCIEVPAKATVATLKGLLGPEMRTVQYGRPSSLGKQIENMTNLQKWSERAVALGCFLDFVAACDQAAEPALFVELLGLDDDHYDLDDADARTLLDAIAVKAKNIAQAGIAAERGTHTHALTEDADNERDWIERARSGEDLGIPEAAQRALVAAWEQMLDVEGIEILAVETAVVDDEWRQAGTLDRIARLTADRQFVRPGGEIVTLPAGWVGVLDVKTGRLRAGNDGHPDYWHGYAVQIASYAQAVPYDPDTDTRGTWEWPIDQQWGIIAHLDVGAALDGEARCRLVLVDLAAGREAGERCVWGRSWEKRRDVFSLVVDDGVSVLVEQIAAPSPPAGDVEQRAAGPESAQPPAPAVDRKVHEIGVVGVTFATGYPDNLHRLAEVHDDITRGEPLTVELRRNPDNGHDANAVEIHVPVLGELAMIGHVPRDTAAKLAPRMDEGVAFEAWVRDVRIDPKHMDRPGIDIAVVRAENAEEGADPASTLSAPVATGWPEGVVCARGRCGGCGRTVNLINHQCETTPEPPPPTVDRREQLRERKDRIVAGCRNLDLADHLRRGGPRPKVGPHEARFRAELKAHGISKTSTDDEIQAALDAIEPPFDPEPQPVVETAPRNPRPVVETPDNGGPLDPGSLAVLMAAIKNSPQRLLVNAWLKQASDAGESWSPRIHATVRHFEIARAAFAVAIATSDSSGNGDDEYARLILAHVVAGADQPVLPIGVVFGTLSIDDARRVTAIAEAFGNRLTLLFHEDGTPHLEGDVAAVLAAA